jgi:hypothetical protein
MLREHQWRRFRPLGRRRYIWRLHVLPFGVPFGVMIAAHRFVQLGMSWKDLFTLTGAAVAYFTIAVSMLLTAGWGLAAWQLNQHQFGGSDS